MKGFEQKVIKTDNLDNIPNKEKPATTIEINGIRIEVKKENFEYSEQIQKETGILGYERFVINKENLIDFIKKDFKKEFGIDIEQKGFTNIDSLDDFKEKSKKEYEQECQKIRSRYGSDSKECKEFFESTENKIYSKIRNLNTDTCYKIIRVLSNQEYPDRCFTHEIGFDYGKEQKENFKKELVKNKFFIQKIYDIDSIKEKARIESPQKIFNAIGNLEGEIRSDITIFDKKTGEKINSNQSVLIAELAKPEYFEGIKNGDLFACTPNSGFNVSTGKFFLPPNIKLSNEIPSFGFSMKENFFNKYLNKALDIYTKEIKGFDFKKEKKEKYKHIYNHGINSLIKELIFSDNSIQNIFKRIFNQEENQWFKPFIIQSFDSFWNDFSKIVNDVIKKLETQHNIKILDYIKERNFKKEKNDDSYNFSEWLDPAGIFGLEGELRLPIFIGRDDIPQLCWGHAKYAHFMSPKGFNFIEFKHADHLPSKTD